MLPPTSDPIPKRLAPHPKSAPSPPKTQKYLMRKSFIIKNGKKPDDPPLDRLLS